MYISSFTKNMDDAAHTVKKKMGEMMISQLLSWLITAGFVIGGIIVLAVIIVSISLSNPFETPGISGIIGIAAIYAGILILAFAGADIAQGSVLLITDSAIRDKKLAGVKAVGMSFKKFPKYLGFVCLQGLVLLPVIVLTAVIVGTIAATFNNFSFGDFISRDIAGTLFLIVLLLLLIVVVICVISVLFETLFLYGMPAMVIDDLGPLEAFKKCIRLLKGEFMSTAKKVFLFSCGIYGVGLSMFTLVVSLVGLVMFLITLGGTELEVAAMQTSSLEWILRIGYRLVTGCFLPAIACKLYFSQKCKKEGQDIHMKLAQLRKAQQLEQAQRLEQAQQVQQSQSVQPDKETLS